MEYSHEIVLPNEDIPFRMFIFCLLYTSDAADE